MNKYLGKVIAGVVFFGIVVWVLFFFVNNRKSNDIFDATAKDTTGEVQTLISKNLDNKHYPSNVQQVVKLYQRYHVCFMTKSYTEEEYNALLDQMRKLFDNEFLEINPRDTHSVRYQQEIKAFKDKKGGIPITDIQLQSQVVKFKSKDGDEMASIVAYFMTKEGSDIKNVYEKFLLRKDINGNWKIVGWELTDPVDLTD